MRLTWAPTVLPLATAGLCGILVPIEAWNDHSAKLLTALGVVGAAVLVRLARGLVLPVADGLEIEEARRLTEAMQIMVRKLRVLIFVILATMIALVALPAIMMKLDTLLVGFRVVAVCKMIASGFIGLSLAYVFVRIMQVVGSDVGLVDIQANVFMQSLSRKQATKFEEERAKSTVAPFKAPEGYGKKIS
ncbi:MAG TPA: hypothetical protein VJ750_09645 [Rhizomicrobium sp.]|nr:hypothetical protein [Rhizomicrobium sp.]